VVKEPPAVTGTALSAVPATGAVAPTMEESVATEPASIDEFGAGLVDSE
jgi:hypothetical protein